MRFIVFSLFCVAFFCVALNAYGQNCDAALNSRTEIEVHSKTELIDKIME